MIISEKQILRLIDFALSFYGLLALIDAKQSTQKEIIDVLDEIRAQQSEEIEDSKVLDDE